MVLQNIMAVYFIYIIDLTISKQVWLCLLNTPYSYGILWGISCEIHSATLRCLLRLITQIFSSMINIIDSWFSCYTWFLHHAEILWTYSNVFILLFHQVDTSIYIDSIHQLKFYEVEESTTHDSRSSMDHIHHHVWFLVSESHVQSLDNERI